MRRSNRAPFWISASIQRTADPKHATRGLRHDMRVDHRRLDVSVAEQRPDGADVGRGSKEGNYPSWLRQEG